MSLIAKIDKNSSWANDPSDFEISEYRHSDYESLPGSPIQSPARSTTPVNTSDTQSAHFRKGKWVRHKKPSSMSLIDKLKFFNMD